MIHRHYAVCLFVLQPAIRKGSSSFVLFNISNTAVIALHHYGLNIRPQVLRRILLLVISLCTATFLSGIYSLYLVSFPHYSNFFF
jgi:uncharacterized membrane protein